MQARRSSRLRRSWRARLPDVKWSRKVENLHITVKFLGQIDGGRSWPRWRGSGAGGGAAAAVPSCELRGMGAFPSARNANVVWAGVEDVSAGWRGRGRPSKGVGERFGFPREQRAFTGHVTVGRVEGGAASTRARRWTRRRPRLRRMTVERVHVYESRLGRPKGSTYVLRSRAALGSQLTARRHDHGDDHDETSEDGGGSEEEDGEADAAPARRARSPRARRRSTSRLRSRSSSARGASCASARRWPRPRCR